MINVPLLYSGNYIATSLLKLPQIYQIRFDLQPEIILQFPQTSLNSCEKKGNLSIIDMPWLFKLIVNKSRALCFRQGTVGPLQMQHNHQLYRFP